MCLKRGSETQAARRSRVRLGASRLRKRRIYHPGYADVPRAEETRARAGICRRAFRRSVVPWARVRRPRRARDLRPVQTASSSSAPPARALQTCVCRICFAPPPA
eukprot:8396401-Pyramimonas_sp.AAC.1